MHHIYGEKSVRNALGTMNRVALGFLSKENEE